ncbi:YfhO family protein, partial [uncultured Bifidobacterium sp.]|uniref:YfhO family protein n=1 Tax=uncultured Bifidobacterium sp. TaxID=165187 RepID=UPI00261D97E0
ALSAVIYLMLVAGMPTYAAYFLYLAGAYMLFYGLRTYIHEPRKCPAYMGWFMVAVAVGAVLSLPYTLQLLDSLQSSGYTDTRKSFASAVLGIPQIKTLLFPYFSTSSAVHPNEGTLFAGVLAVVSLPLTAVNKRRKPRSMFFLISAAIILLLIFTHVGDAFYSLLPAISSSLKFRVIVLLDFCLSVLVGINMDDLLIHKPSGRREILSVIIASFIGVAGYAFAFRRVLPLTSSASIGVSTHVWLGCAVVVVFVIIVLMRLVTDRTWLVQLCTVALFCVVALDMGYFGYHYWPAISSGASSIPKATPSVTSLQKGTKNGEKIVSVGNWDFFPMTNVFYGIQNVNAHGFLYTQTDVSAYYKAIDSGIFNQSPTRPVLTSVDQGAENLLQYMGVKYVVGQSASIEVPDTSGTDKQPYGQFVDGSVYEQTFTSQNDDLKAISLHVKPSGQGMPQGTVTMTLRDDSTNEVVASSTQSLSSVTKESSLTFGFSAITDSSGKTYTMSLTSNAPAGSGVDFYMTTGDAYAGTAGDALAKATGDMAITCVYEGVTSEDDGLALRRLSDYTAKVQLTDDVKVVDTDKAVLSGMKASFEKTAVYFSSESGVPDDASTSRQPKLTSGEKVSNVVEKPDGSMSFTVSTKQKRFVVVNEYNDGNWVAYVDGRRVTMYKGNYLFRAIEVSSGTHVVELRYVNSSINTTLVVSSAVGLMMVVIFVATPRYDAWRRKKWGFLQRPPRHLKAC